MNSKYAIFISFISALGGYLFGFDFAVIAGALPFLKQIFQLNPWWEGFLTGTLAIGCMFGCISAGWFAERLGRKPSLMISAIIFTLSSIGIAFANTLPIFLMMRFCAGIGVGMASMLSPMYIAEVSPAEIRGRNVSINQLTIVLGILITNLVNYFLADWGPDAWRWMFGLGAIPSILFFIGVCFLPESPRWLMLNKRTEEALLILEKIGGKSFAEKTKIDFQTINKTAATQQKLFQKKYLPALYVGVVLAIFQQFCGINVVFNYTSILFKSLGADLNRQLLETIFIGIVNVIFTIVAMFQVDKLGRKPLMLFGTIGLSISYMMIAIILQLQLAPIVLSLFVLIAIGIYSSTIAPVTWVLISEIFPNEIRGKASSFAILCLWAAYFVLVFTFPILAEKLGTFGPFWMYAVICLLGYVFIKSNVKETKGQTLEQLENVFGGH
jgi:SP family xylose:H+ symportor-like MFS transporter